MAIFLDPTGGYIAIWEPRRRAGADKVGAPVSLGWVELRSRDLGRAAEFYAAIFGWEARESDGYTRFHLGGAPVAGALPLGPEVPEEIPAHWMAYFSVADVDAIAARAAELGAVTHHPPTDMGEAGRFAVLGDPQGAPFAVLAMAR